MLLAICAIVLATFFIPSVSASSDFVGTWNRYSLTVDGESQSFCNARLELTETTWRSYTTGGGGEYCDCDLSGTLTAQNGMMTWVIQSVSGDWCGVASPGDTYTFSYSVSNDGNTLTLTTGSQVEVYTKVSGGSSGSDDSNGNGGGTPGFEILSVIAAFGIAFIILNRKKE